MVQLTIDGKQIEVQEGITVIKAAKQAGIKIPALCGHPNLTPYGGCRLCVVEIEGMRTLQTACTLPVSNNMVVRTNTELLHESRKFILSMLFSERNHYCMYCQVSGGECELQNAALAEGMDHWPLQPNWVNFPVDSSHPYFVLDHNRCILCRRCVRACAEITGNFTLATENRGAQTMIIADYNVPLGESSCVSCGNCVQICPTGALIDRQSAYRGLAPDADHIPSTCVGCSVGCSVDLIVRDNQLLRVNGDYQGVVNKGAMCELGRFVPIFSKNTRLHTPMVKKNGSLKAASWEEAFSVINSKLKGNKSVAALVSTRLSAEALYAFKKIFIDHLGSSMVTSIEEHIPTAGLDQVIEAGLEANLNDLNEADTIIALGADLFRSHQVAGFIIKRNLPKGVRLAVIDVGENMMAERADLVIQPKPGTDYDLLMGLAGKKSFEEVAKTSYVSEKAFKELQKLIAEAKRPIFVYGKGITFQEGKKNEKSPLKALIELAKTVQGKLFSPKGKANSLAGHAYGLDKMFTAEGCDVVYMALGDDEASQNLMQRLENVPFLIVQASYDSKLTAKADVVLPVNIWAEEEGHYLNLEGRLQETKAGLTAPEGVLPNVQVFEAIAKALGASLDGNWKSDLEKYIRE